jgi:hypothetical protein
MRGMSTEYLNTCRSALAAEQAASLAETNGWSHVDRDQVHRDWDVLYRALAVMPDDAEASSLPVQELVARHHAIACRFYLPSQEAYIGMSLFYEENPDMRSFHDAYGPHLLPLLTEAMRVFAQRSP